MSGGRLHPPSPLSHQGANASSGSNRDALDGRDRLPALDESEIVDEKSISRNLGPHSSVHRPPSYGGGGSGRTSPTKAVRMSPSVSPIPSGGGAFLTEFDMEERSSSTRPESRNSMFEYSLARPYSRQSVMSVGSCHSFKSIPVAAISAAHPLWASMPTHRKRHRERLVNTSRSYGTLPTGTSMPASFSGLLSGSSTRSSTPFISTPDKPKMPRLMDVILHEDGHSRSVGLQAAPCMWTRFFFETSQQDSDMSASKNTPTYQHFDVTFQPDPLGGIDMSGKANRSKGTSTHAMTREWIQRSHESVFLVTQVLPPDTFVDTENVKDLKKSGETSKIWPLPACEEQRDPEDLEHAELVDLIEYTRTVCRMEPRSGDDSRQLIKLQRGVLTAVVTMFDKVESKYEEKFQEKSKKLKKTFEEWSIPIEAENARLKAMLAEFEALKERLKYMEKLEKEMAEQKVMLHDTQDALQDALSKLADLKDVEAKSREMESMIEELKRQLAETTKELKDEKGARMALKFELTTLKKLLAAAKNAEELQKLQDELVKLQIKCNQQEVTISEQSAEIERLQKLLDAAKEKIQDLEALVKQYEEAMEMQKKKGDNETQALKEELEQMRSAMKELQNELDKWRGIAKFSKLHARVLGAMVARSGNGELAQCSIPPKCKAIMPEGYLPYGQPVEIMLHKDTIVRLPEVKALSDGSFETPRHKLLKPGEERRVGDMEPIEEPLDFQLKQMADCLDGQDPSYYAWVKVPMGVEFTNPGTVETQKALLVPGTVITLLADANIEVPPASSLGLLNIAQKVKRSLSMVIPKAANLSMDDGIEKQVQPQSDADSRGMVKYSLPDGTGIAMPTAKGPKEDIKISAPEGTLIVVPPETLSSGNSRAGGSKVGNRLSGFSFARKNCFWCRMRMVGKDDEDDDDGDTMENIFQASSIPIRQQSGIPLTPRHGGVVGFQSKEMECNEDCGTLRVPVSRSNGSAGAVEIEIATADGSANEIVDYIPPKVKRIRWEDGDAEDKYIDVGIVDDDFTTEGDETFHISIEELLDGEIGIGIQRLTVTIKDVPREGARAVIATPRDLLAEPTSLAWEAEGFREMTIPPSWKKLLGKAKIDGAKMMNPDKCRKLVTALYAAKREADKVDDKAGNDRAPLAEYCADFFKNHWGVVGLGKKIAEFIARLRYEYRRKEDVLVNQYTCLAGIYDRQPQVAHYVVVKGYHIASGLCSATGCNPQMFWNQLNKGKQLYMKAQEAHEFLTFFLTNKDQQGNTFISPEVDMDECHTLLESVLAKEAEKAGQEGVIELARLMSFAISTILWLNKRAESRINASFQSEAGKDGTLDYDAFKAGLQNLIAWNERTTRNCWEEALSHEDAGSARVKIASCIAAVLELHDVVAFSSVS